MSLKLNERYPARFNNPTAGYPQGSFKNRTTPTAKDGSYLEKDWANDKEGFFQSLLSSAGITANGAVDAVGASQFFDALQALKQIQAGTAFTTTGSAGALTLAPTPAVPAYSAPLRFRVKFSQASIGADTINVSGLGAKNIKQYDSTGAKVAAVFAANQLADIEYDGTDFVLLDQLPQTIAADPWLYQPVGVPIAVFDNIAGVSQPPTTNSAYRYIKMTAADAYNTGVLTSESVTGSAPLVIATAVVSLSGSPINGQTVQLINTERRSLRAGNSGGVEADQGQGHRHSPLARTSFVGLGSGNWVLPGGPGVGDSSTTGDPVTDGANGTPRIGNETRSKNIGVTYYMRVK